jgi:branched-chain amino acid transport system ATP-binding protein
VENDVIDFLEIEHLRYKTVGGLSYGLQKRVELARALAMRPKVLLLDEPIAGMNQEETEDMARFILDIKEERGVTLVLIEHHMGVVMDICDRIAALNFGVKITEGTPAQVKETDVVKAPENRIARRVEHFQSMVSGGSRIPCAHRDGVRQYRAATGSSIATTSS